MTTAELEVPPPKIVVHQAISLDGRIEGFEADIGLFYLLAQHWGFNIHLAGSDTILAAPQEENSSETDECNSDTTLAVVDSQGRVKSWESMQKAPFWGKYLSLGSERTPKSHLEYLEGIGIQHWESEGERVDLKAAMQYMAASHQARTILLDSGGTLSTLLIDQGLVDELSLLIHPVLVGSSKARGFYRSSDDRAAKSGHLQLDKTEKLPGNKLWLRFIYRPENLE